VLFFRPITAIIYSNAAEVINLLPELPTIDGIGLGPSAINDEILRQLAANKSIKYLALESEDPNQPLIPNVVELTDRIRQKLPGVKVAW
jgi:methionine synthase II (cobalamin-independent)